MTEVAAAPVALSRWRWIYAAAALLVLLFAAAWWWRSRAPSSSEPGVGVGLSLRQLTQDTARTIDPAISPDGKLVAYASDRSGDAGLDIWVQQLTSGARSRSDLHGTRPTTESHASPRWRDCVRRGGEVHVTAATGQKAIRAAVPTAPPAALRRIPRHNTTICHKRQRFH